MLKGKDLEIQFQKIIDKHKPNYKPTDYVYYVNSDDWNDSGLIVRRFQGFEIIPSQLIPKDKIYFMKRQDLEGFLEQS
jgi:hypothetical protein